MYQERKRFSEKKKSFFLLEILVAMAIFALAIVPMLTMNWSILGAEAEENRLFKYEMELKSHALSTIEALYTGQYNVKTLEEGVLLDSFDGRMQLEDKVVTISYVMPKGTVREFSVVTSKKKKSLN